jgi:hypothetical protein
VIRRTGREQPALVGGLCVCGPSSTMFSPALAGDIMVVLLPTACPPRRVCCRMERDAKTPGMASGAGSSRALYRAGGLVTVLLVTYLLI